MNPDDELKFGKKTTQYVPLDPTRRAALTTKKTTQYVPLAQRTGQDTSTAYQPSLKVTFRNDPKELERQEALKDVDTRLEKWRMEQIQKNPAYKYALTGEGDDDFFRVNKGTKAGTLAKYAISEALAKERIIGEELGAGDEIYRQVRRTGAVFRFISSLPQFFIEKTYGAVALGIWDTLSKAAPGGLPLDGKGGTTVTGDSAWYKFLIGTERERDHLGRITSEKPIDIKSIMQAQSEREQRMREKIPEEQRGTLKAELMPVFGSRFGTVALYMLDMDLSVLPVKTFSVLFKGRTAMRNTTSGIIDIIERSGGTVDDATRKEAQNVAGNALRAKSQLESQRIVNDFIKASTPEGSVARDTVEAIERDIADELENARMVLYNQASKSSTPETFIETVTNTLKAERELLRGVLTKRIAEIRNSEPFVDATNRYQEIFTKYGDVAGPEGAYTGRLAKNAPDDVATEFDNLKAQIADINDNQIETLFRQFGTLEDDIALGTSTFDFTKNLLADSGDELEPMLRKIFDEAQSRTGAAVRVATGAQKLAKDDEILDALDILQRQLNDARIARNFDKTTALQRANEYMYAEAVARGLVKTTRLDVFSKKPGNIVKSVVNEKQFVDSGKIGVSDTLLKAALDAERYEDFADFVKNSNEVVYQAESPTSFVRDEAVSSRIVGGELNPPVVTAMKQPLDLRDAAEAAWRDVIEVLDPALYNSSVRSFTAEEAQVLLTRAQSLGFDGIIFARNNADGAYEGMGRLVAHDSQAINALQFFDNVRGGVDNLGNGISLMKRRADVAESFVDAVMLKVPGFKALENKMVKLGMSKKIAREQMQNVYSAMLTRYLMKGTKTMTKKEIRNLAEVHQEIGDVMAGIKTRLLFTERNGLQIQSKGEVTGLNDLLDSKEVTDLYAKITKAFDKDVVKRTREMSEAKFKGAVSESKFVAKGKGHAAFNESLKEMVDTGVFLPEEAMLIRTAFADVADEVLERVPLLQRSRGWMKRYAETRFRLGGIFKPNTNWVDGARMRRGLAYTAMANRTRKNRALNYITEQRFATEIVLHEYGHVGFRVLLSSQQRKFVKQLFNSLSEDEKIAMFGNQTINNLETFRHFMTDENEFFAQLYSQYVMHNKLTHRMLEPLYQRVTNVLKQGIRALIGKAPSEKLEGLAPLFEQVLRGESRQRGGLKTFRDPDLPKGTKITWDDSSIVDAYGRKNSSNIAVKHRWYTKYAKPNKIFGASTGRSDIDELLNGKSKMQRFKKGEEAILETSTPDSVLFSYNLTRRRMDKSSVLFDDASPGHQAFDKNAMTRNDEWMKDNFARYEKRELALDRMLAEGKKIPSIVIDNRKASGKEISDDDLFKAIWAYQRGIEFVPVVSVGKRPATGGAKNPWKFNDRGWDTGAVQDVVDAFAKKRIEKRVPLNAGRKDFVGKRNLVSRTAAEEARKILLAGPKGKSIPKATVARAVKKVDPVVEKVKSLPKKELLDAKVPSTIADTDPLNPKLLKQLLPETVFGKGVRVAPALRKGQEKLYKTIATIQKHWNGERARSIKAIEELKTSKEDMLKKFKGKLSTEQDARESFLSLIKLKQAQMKAAAGVGFSRAQTDELMRMGLKVHNPKSFRVAAQKIDEFLDIQLRKAALSKLDNFIDETKVGTDTIPVKWQERIEDVIGPRGIKIKAFKEGYEKKLKALQEYIEKQEAAYQKVLETNPDAPVPPENMRWDFVSPKTIAMLDNLKELGKKKSSQFTTLELLEMVDEIEKLFNEGRVAKFVMEGGRTREISRTIAKVDPKTGKPMLSQTGVPLTQKFIVQKGGEYVPGIKELRTKNQIEYIKEQVKAGKVTNMDSSNPVVRKYGDLAADNSVMGQIAKGLKNNKEGDWRRWMHLNYLSVDRVFELMDNFTSRGPLYNLIRKPLSEAAQRGEDAARVIDEKFAKTEKMLEEKFKTTFTDANYERIAMHAYLQQDGGLAKMLKSGISKAETDAAKSLKPHEREMYLFMREELDKTWPAIDKTMRDVHGQRLGKIRNYFPVQNNLLDSRKVHEVMLDEFTVRKSGVQKNFTKQRYSVTGGMEMRVNARDIFRKYMKDSNYFIEVEPEIRRITALTKDPELTEAIGRNYTRFLNAWIDIVARRGTPQNYDFNLWDVLHRNLSAATLGFNPSPIIKQPLAVFAAGGLIGLDNIAVNGYALMKRHKLFDAIADVSTELRLRAMDDPAFTELALTRRLSRLQEKGYAGIKRADSYTARAVWLAAYTKRLGEKGKLFSPEDFKNGIGIDADALDFADNIVRKTQGSGKFQDLPLMLSTNNKKVWRTIFQFQTFVLGQSQMLTHDALHRTINAGMRNGMKSTQFKDATGRALKITGSISAGIYLEDEITQALTSLYGSDSFEEYLDDRGSLQRASDYLGSALPPYGFVAGLMQSNNPNTGVPVLDKVWSAGREGVAAFTKKDGEAKIKSASRAIEALIALSTGAPGTGFTGTLLRGQGVGMDNWFKDPAEEMKEAILRGDKPEITVLMDKFRDEGLDVNEINTKAIKAARTERSQDMKDLAEKVAQMWVKADTVEERDAVRAYVQKLRDKDKLPDGFNKELASKIKSMKRKISMGEL